MSLLLLFNNKRSLKLVTINNINTEESINSFVIHTIYRLLVDSIPSEESYGGITLFPGKVSLLIDNLVTQENIFDFSIIPGKVVLGIDSISTAEIINDFVVVPLKVTIRINELESLEVAGSIRVVWDQFIKLSAIPSSELLWTLYVAKYGLFFKMFSARMTEGFLIDASMTDIYSVNIVVNDIKSFNTKIREGKFATRINEKSTKNAVVFRR
jgi:hypothetical protein